MKIHYDAEVDALYIEFHPLADGTAEARPLSDDLIANYGPDGKLAGLEILDASQCWARGKGAWCLKSPRRWRRLLSRGKAFPTFAACGQSTCLGKVPVKARALRGMPCPYSCPLRSSGLKCS